jgi:hypothetical protein
MRVVLICSNYILGRLVLPSLREIGARCYLICDKRAAHLRLSRCCDRLLLASDDLASERPERVIEVINRLVRSEGIDYVLASDVDALVLLAGIAGRLECPTFPLSSVDVLKRLNNKWQFHNICRACDVDVPKSIFYPSKYQINSQQIGDLIGFPAVIKPVGEWGGAGVTTVGDSETIGRTIIRNEDYKFQEVLVQEYIDGQDAGFGGLAWKGKLRHWTTFVLHERGSVEFTALPQLVQAAEKIIASLAFTGVINFDVRLNTTSGAVKFLECNPRFFVRIRASRLCGLDLVRAGLGSKAASKQQPQSLTKGKYFPLGSLMSGEGWRQVASGGWSMSSALRTAIETLSDPLPLLAEFTRSRPIDRVKRPAAEIPTSVPARGG